MTTIRNNRLLRLAAALILAFGISAGVNATSASGNGMDCDNTPIDCGGGCYVSVTNCPECTRSPGECAFYFEDPSCNFWCTAQCTYCELFENE